MCIASMKTVTTAQRARKALASEGIAASVVSIDPNLTKNGCAVGVRFSCSDVLRIKKIFSEKGIAYGEIFGG